MLFDKLTWGPVIGAKDIRKLPSHPNLYVVTALSDGKSTSTLRTQKRKNERPTWHDTRPLCVFHVMSISLDIGLIYLADRSAYPLSVLSFGLKHYNRLLSNSFLGSVGIKADELLDRCKHGERMPC